MARRGVFDAIVSKDEYMQPEQRKVPVRLAASSILDSDELIECPYDKVHRIRLSRFPMHLLKCRKNYTGKDMFVCPFNACHLVPNPEARHHIATCPDKAAIEKDMIQGYDVLNNTYCKGYTKVPEYYRKANDYHDPTENWDEEIKTPSSREYWGPENGHGDNSGAHSLPKPRGRGAPRAMGNMNPPQPEMRLPRQPAQAAAVAQQRHQHIQQQNQSQPAAAMPGTDPTAAASAQPMMVAGLGRGQFKGRVMAANLWGSQPQQAVGQPSPTAAAAAAAAQVSQPRPGGLAQSGWAQPTQNGPTSAAFNDEDFPALGGPEPSHIGLGRGLGRGAALRANPTPIARPGGLQNGTM